ncbi:MAG: hypothetical protein H7A33_03465 [Deltaproteobacteria bacterium]|nr:hypothetical protein [Deltaproteobacteria bacterium]
MALPQQSQSRQIKASTHHDFSLFMGDRSLDHSILGRSVLTTQQRECSKQALQENLATLRKYLGISFLEIKPWQISYLAEAVHAVSRFLIMSEAVLFVFDQERKETKLLLRRLNKALHDRATHLVKRFRQGSIGNHELFLNESIALKHALQNLYKLKVPITEDFDYVTVSKAIAEICRSSIKAQEPHQFQRPRRSQLFRKEKNAVARFQSYWDSAELSDAMPDLTNSDPTLLASLNDFRGKIEKNYEAMRERFVFLPNEFLNVLQIWFSKMEENPELARKVICLWNKLSRFTDFEDDPNLFSSFLRILLFAPNMETLDFVLSTFDCYWKVVRGLRQTLGNLGGQFYNYYRLGSNDMGTLYELRVLDYFGSMEGVKVKAYGKKFHTGDRWQEVDLLIAIWDPNLQDERLYFVEVKSGPARIGKAQFKRYEDAIEMDRAADRRSALLYVSHHSPYAGVDCFRGRGIVQATYSQFGSGVVDAESLLGWHQGYEALLRAS